MKNSFNKMILAVLTVALVFASFPATSAFAQGQNPPKLTNEKMEEIWARILRRNEKMGKMFDENNPRLTKLQELIDKAKANGKDVVAVQTALDNFKAALKTAKPIYESIKGIVASHQGFDANGKVTDAEKAKSTLKDLRDKSQELKSALDGTRKALGEAIKSFRAANKPAINPGR